MIFRLLRSLAIAGQLSRQPLKKFLLGLLTCGFGLSASGALNTTCTYDENALSPNVVDRSAPFLGGDGAGDKSGLVPDLRSFVASITAACQGGVGGVVDFESGELDSPMSFTVLFGGNGKSFVVRQSTESGYVVRTYEKEVRTPVSGKHALAKEMGSPHYEFRLGPVTGGVPNEHVIALGLTLLGRNNSNARSQWTGVATIPDRQGNTGIITNRITNLNTGTGNATDDTFFGFRAPPGFFIVSGLLLSDTGAFTSVEDLAFLTAVVADPLVANPAPSPSPGPEVSTAPNQPIASPSGGSGGFSAEWMIVGALGMIILLLLGLILLLKRFGRHASLLPAPVTSASVQRGNLHSQFPPELTEFAKQELVQGLYSQRQALIETQKLAEQRLIELQQWLGQLQLPLQGRIKAYEDRIAALEKELATKDESMRELTKATLLLVRRKLAEEKERERTYSRFS